MKHVHCKDCANVAIVPAFRPNEGVCLAASVPMSTKTVRDVLSLSRKSLILSRMCEDFKPGIPTLTEEIGAIV